MDLYLDKNNLYSLIKAEKVTDADLYSECRRLIKRRIHLIYNFSKESFRIDTCLQMLLLQMSSGRGTSEETDEFKSEVFPDRPVKTNFRNGMPWKIFMSMFLLDDEKTASLKNCHSMLAGGVGEEIDLLRALFCTRDYELNSLYSIRDNNSFPGWNILKEDGHIMPCSDIVIADRYLFKTNDIQALDHNLYALLRLFAEEKAGHKVNIVFFTDEVSEAVCSEIKRSIEHIFGKKSGTKVTFVFHNHDRPHDRFILTNYRLFRMGDSLNNFYDARGNLITKGLTLDVGSMANSDVVSVVQQIQNWYQDICDKNLDRIFGDKQSNFISFKQ